MTHPIGGGRCCKGVCGQGEEGVEVVMKYEVWCHDWDEKRGEGRSFELGERSHHIAADKWLAAQFAEDRDEGGYSISASAEGSDKVVKFYASAERSWEFNVSREDPI